MELNACKLNMSVVLKDHFPPQKLRTGARGVIIGIERDLIVVRLPDGTSSSWSPGWWEPEPLPTLTPGDRVKLGRGYPDDAHPANGNPGTVLDVVVPSDFSAATVFVKFDNGVEDEFGVEVLELLPPAPVNYVEGSLVRVVKEGDRWHNKLGSVWSIDERNEHPIKVSMHLQPGSYADEGEGDRYTAEQLTPWVPTQADAEAVVEYYIRMGFRSIPTPMRGFEPFTAWFKEQEPRLAATLTARAKRVASLTGHTPYIRAGRYTLRVDSIRVVEETNLGVWVTDYEQAGSPEYSDNRGILIVNKDAERFRSWLNDLTYDLADEDYKAGTEE